MASGTTLKQTRLVDANICGFAWTSTAPVGSCKYLYMNVWSPKDFDTPWLLAQSTSLNMHTPQLAHWDITTTWAAGQGALSCCVWWVSTQEILDWHVALSPKMTHSELQPKSAPLVVCTLVEGTTSASVLELVVAAVVVVATVELALWGFTRCKWGLAKGWANAGVFSECAVVTATASTVVTAVVSAKIVAVLVRVFVFVWVFDVVERVSVFATVRVELTDVVSLVVVILRVLVWVTVFVYVTVPVDVDVMVVGTVVVGGHPFASCWQHHAFQSGVHAHSHMSASASQS
jgi:hypothetical protein